MDAIGVLQFFRVCILHAHTFFRCYFDAMEKLSFMRLQHPNQSHSQQRDKLIEVERQSQI